MTFIDKIITFLDEGEDNPRDSVPEGDRRSWISTGMVFTGVYISTASIIEGLTLVGGLPFKQAVLAQLTGFIIFLTLIFVQGNIGTETGLTTYMLARKSFGLKGSNIISLIILLGDFGWFAIQSRATAESLATIFGWSNIPLISIICGVLMMLTALLGYRAIAIISVPTVIYTFGLMIYLAISSITGSVVNFADVISNAPLSDPFTFAAGVSIVVGGMAVGAVSAPDITRFSKSKRDNFKALFFMVLPVAILQPIASMIVGLYSNSTNIAYVLTKTGGIFGMLLVLMGGWTSNDNNLYSSSLALSEIIGKGKRWHLTIIIGVLASIVSGIIDMSIYENLMYILGAFSLPVLGITLCDYYILPKVGLKSGMAKENNEIINFCAVISWIIGGLYQSGIDFEIIPNPLGIPSALTTIPLVGIIYLIMMKLKHRN